MTEAFGKLADSAIRDPRMTPAHLVVLAYRTTFADQKSAFGLRVGLMGKLVSGKGLGKNRAQQILADLIEWGYLSRHQPPVTRQGACSTLKRPSMRSQCLWGRIAKCGEAGFKGNTRYRNWRLTSSSSREQARER